MGRPWDEPAQTNSAIHRGLTGVSETDKGLQTSVVETATGQPVRWTGGISNHAVDNTAAHVDSHR